MMNEMNQLSLQETLTIISNQKLSPFDLLPHSDIREKLIELILRDNLGVLDFAAKDLLILKEAFENRPVDDAKVVVFGGGSGLSNIVGGDSRNERWTKNPFCGLKDVFPHTKSIVCITDDGGSTGELLKDLPVIAIGDIRHVLLSAIQLGRLQKQYSLSVKEANAFVEDVAAIFNLRFKKNPGSVQKIFDLAGIEKECFPNSFSQKIEKIIYGLFNDSRLTVSLNRPNCLGNLIIVAAVYSKIPQEYGNEHLARYPEILQKALFEGLCELTELLGVEEAGVLPCTCTPAQLRVRYSNGVQIRGESKSGLSSRGFPVEKVVVDYCGQPKVYDEVIQAINEADILVMAPGSLYSSIIPIFQIPAIADAVRNNSKALKLLVSNLWVQAGETDLSMEDPQRKYRISDMLGAYENNIPGGVVELFKDVLCLSLKDVPASILQRYAVEGKVPIYLDKKVVFKKGYSPIECGIFSKKVLEERGVIQHDPDFLGKVIKTLYVARRDLGLSAESSTHTEDDTVVHDTVPKLNTNTLIPSLKYQKLVKRIHNLQYDIHEEIKTGDAAGALEDQLVSILWKHHDIPLKHLDHFSGIMGVTLKRWHRDQQWDNVYSFFDPKDGFIKIREDQFYDVKKLETAFLIALGQSLLGRYSAEKYTNEITEGGERLGKVFHLKLAPENEWDSFFSYEQLVEFLLLSRMTATTDKNHFTRLVSGEEGFSPPGMLMGLVYVWYLDNRMTNYLEYKMSILKIKHSPLIPEQTKMCSRRERIIRFFREIVFV